MLMEMTAGEKGRDKDGGGGWGEGEGEIPACLLAGIVCDVCVVEYCV
jgi:hypothetical protein